MNIVYVFIGGGIGSVLRYALGRLSKTWDIPLPIGTFLSNILAAAILAIVWSMSDERSSKSWFYPLLAIGFCGGLSTFSTFSLETVQLMRNGQWMWAIFNVVFTTVICLLIVYRLSRNVSV
ncbi:MAG: fluoride efflux transporter CrcB [Flavobacteriales bacterium]|nr:fluoride efflux transporter CrcB [Flavobacteriales bacterium]